MSDPALYLTGLRLLLTIENDRVPITPTLTLTGALGLTRKQRDPWKGFRVVGTLRVPPEHLVETLRKLRGGLDLDIEVPRPEYAGVLGRVAYEFKDFVFAAVANGVSYFTVVTPWSGEAGVRFVTVEQCDVRRHVEDLLPQVYTKEGGAKHG